MQCGGQVNDTLIKCRIRILFLIFLIIFLNAETTFSQLITPNNRVINTINVREPLDVNSAITDALRPNETA